MKKHYLIDGYNWLLRQPPGSSLSLLERRRAFLEHIYTLTKGSCSLITVVFDSSDPHRQIYSRGNFRDIEVIFTPKKQTADQYIEEFVEQADSARSITVVTKDRELKEKCILRGAAVISTSAFFSHFNKKSARIHADNHSHKLCKESSAHQQRLLEIFEKNFKKQ